MGVTAAQSYLSDILHIISQGLLIPTILLLLGFIAYALYCIGSVIAEYFNERKNFTVAMPKFLAALMSAKQDEIPAVIEESGLLNRQKVALLTVYDYRTLPGDALVALIRRLVSEEETRYDRISSRNNMAARVSPMIGLMGTLIPLGPGIEALGRADTSALSSSLLIAFDTTVAGLVVAAICLIIGKVRGNWYGNYMSALDSAMATMLQKIEDMRAAGEITIEEPSDYAFLFESAHGKNASGAQADKKSEESDAAAGANAGGGNAEKAAEDRAASEARAWASAAAAAEAQTQARAQAEAQQQAALRQQAQQAQAQQVAAQQQAQAQAQQAAQRAAAQQQAAQQAQQVAQQAQVQPAQQAQADTDFRAAQEELRRRQDAFILKQPVGFGERTARTQDSDGPSAE